MRDDKLETEKGWVGGISYRDFYSSPPNLARTESLRKRNTPFSVIVDGHHDQRAVHILYGG